MIKFFRKIRQNMIKENRTSKYLLYAIGEIILVVIGILIALNINNWNEEQKALSQEIMILENIKEDILLDTLDIRFNIGQHGEYIDAEKRLLHFLRSNHNKPQEAIDYSSALSFPLIISQHESTFNNLQNNQIGLITNNRLKKDISRFYDFYTEAISKVENERPVYETYTGKKVFFQKYFRLSNTSYELDDRQSNNEDYYNPSFTKSDIEFNDVTGAKNDNAFKIELNESIFFRQMKIDFYLNMLKLVAELNEAIDEELALLKKLL
jgi:hypothetical protein